MQRVGLSRRRYHANSIFKQIRPRGSHALFFAAGHWMTTDEMRASLVNEGFHVRHHAGFDATHIGDYRTAFQSGEHLAPERFHLGQRRAKHDEVGIRNRDE
jgi:hypothetical protein